MPIERFCCLLLGGAILVRLLASGMPGALGAAPWDRAAHAGVYALACALLLVGTARRLPLAVAAGVALVGGLEEVQQAFHPGGHADALDFVAAACGALFVAALMSQKPKKDRASCAESLEQ